MTLIYALFTMGGVAALIYEVTWMRTFGLVFGGSTRSAAAVLAAYFAGMAIGNLIGARLSRRSAPLRIYGLAEIAVGLSALLVAPWLAVFNKYYPDLYGQLSTQPAMLTLAKLALSFVALGLPVVAMGTTLPLVARAMVVSNDHVARRTGLLYACNTAGAVVGALLAGMVLPISLGIAHSVHLAAALNIMIGVVAILIRPAAPPAIDVEVPPTAKDGGYLSPPRTTPSVLLIAAISGFGTLAMEMLCMRVLSHHTERSVYVIGLMLATFLFLLAVGAAVVARWGDRCRPWRLLAWSQLVAVAMILLTPVLLHMAAIKGHFWLQDSVGLIFLKRGLWLLIAIGPAVALMGIVLPVAWKIATHHASVASQRVGTLTAVNTVAAVAGSLVAGFVAIPMIGTGGSFLCVALLHGLVVLIAFWRGYGGVVRWAGVLLCAGVLGGWYLSGFWQLNLQSLRPGEQLISCEEGESGTVAVVQQPNGHYVLRLNNRYVLGSSSAFAKEVRQGRLPLLLHPKPRSVAFLGVGTGMTVSAALDFPVERVVAIEIVRGVIEALPAFDRWNRSAFQDERFELVHDDARSYLLGVLDQFDVIVGDLFDPRAAKIGNLLTVEHFRTVKQRLAPHGIFVQWLPGYQLSETDLKTITATFMEVFPSATMWRNDFDETKPIPALVGHRDRLEMDAVSVRVGCRRLNRVRWPPAPFLGNPIGVELLFLAGDTELREWAKDAPLNTDDKPRVEYSAPRSLYSHRARLAGMATATIGRWTDRRWPYGEPFARDLPMDKVFHGAELLHAAGMAKSRQNFEMEYRKLQEAAELLGAVPGVAEHIIVVASRYQRRNMAGRSESLLAALVTHPNPPIAALANLGDAKFRSGEIDEASALLGRAIERAPHLLTVRRVMLRILRQREDYENMEPHIRRLLEAEPEQQFLRADLAHSLHLQGRKSEALQEIERLNQTGTLEERRRVRNYLRRLGMGSYLDKTASEEGSN